MKIDAFCFQFLVCDWKNCWQGCWTEKEYLEIERKMDERDQRVSEEQEKEAVREKQETAASHERAISSSSSSAGEEPPRPATSRSRKAPPKNIEISHTRSVSQLPELGPPLSPIKI